MKVKNNRDMQRAAIAATFVDEPVIIGSVQLTDTEGNEYRHELVLESISLGCMERICLLLDPVSPLIKTLASSTTELDVRNASIEVLINSLYRLSKVIAAACQNSPKPIDPKIVDAVYTQFSLPKILTALREILAKVSFRELSEHFQFKPSKNTTAYPGSNSFWALLVNAMVSFKGCNEHDLKWNMSYTNLLMYCSVLSASRPEDSGGGKPEEGEKVDMWDLFNGMSKESE